MIGLRQGADFAKFTAALAAYAAAAAVVEKSTFNRIKKRERIARLVSFYSRKFLKILRIELKVNGEIPPGNFLVVSNHMGYLDVLCIASQIPTNFVTSVEIRETPFLGYLTRIGGCLYVERRSKKNLRNEVVELTEALSEGLNVGVFPEATSTDGTKILKFRRPLFLSAFESQKPVLPITINYDKIDGREVDIKTRDKLCWYGDLPFLSHILEIMTFKKIEISIDIHAPEVIKSEEEFDSIAQRMHGLISSSFRSLGESSPPAH